MVCPRNGAFCRGMLLALVLCAGCGCVAERKLPRNPILENSQAALDSLEKQLFAVDAPELSPADYLKLGTARHCVWQIYLARSRYLTSTWRGRRRAAYNRRMAERAWPGVAEAFENAAAARDDEITAAQAKVWLARCYALIPDLDKQIGMLQRILVEHSDLDSAFGLSDTPHYYCYYSLSGAYQRKGERAKAIDAMARALMAIEARKKAGANVGNRPEFLLGRLLHYEPRVVLPRYRALLPDGAHAILDRHERTAPARIELTVESVDRTEIALRYKVHFPQLPAIIAARKKRRDDTRPLLPDEGLYDYPLFFVLGFTHLPATAGFDMPKDAPPGFAPDAATAHPSFDKQGKAAGRIVLKWAENAPARRDVYVTAKLLERGMTRSIAVPAIPAHEVYVSPVRITVD
jgi:tetratricopeptide (TPR) repeat protein